MIKHRKLSFKLSASIILLILLVDGVLLVVSYEKKCDQLIEMQTYEKGLYGKNLIYTQAYIDDYLKKYTSNIIILSLLISAIVSIGFFLIYHHFVGKYLTKISRLNNEKSPLKTKMAFRKIPDDEIGDVIKSRVEMLSRIEAEIANNRKLLRILSHDLANLLTINFGSLLALKKVVNMENEKVVKNIDRIEFSNQRQKELIEKVRSFDANKDKLINADAQEFDLLELVKESIKIFEDRLNSKNIEVNIETSLQGMHHVYVDRVLFINNVLNNIFSNAIKFSKENSKILVKMANENGEPILEIKDHGIGIPNELLETLFDGGVNNSRTGVNGEAGTGFGMGLLKSTLDAFNCNINVESKEMRADAKDHGTKITIKFLNNILDEVA